MELAHRVGLFAADERLLIYDAGQCTLGGHSIPYRPFVQAIRSRAAVVQDDDAATVGDKIETLIGRWLIQDGEEPQDLEELRGFLKALLDVSPSMDPDASRTVKEPDAQFVREGLASYYTRLLERAPVLLFVDDFMHASPQTRDLVHFLVERFADAPFTTVLCARSDEMVRLATYLDVDGSSPPIEIHLEPLGESETQRLVRAVLNRADSAPDDLVSAIAHLASGVPQIVVEAIYELIEAEVIRVEDDKWLINPDAQETVRLPESAEELFRERVHRLSPGQRELVEIAAVAGDVFWPDLLVSMAKNAVREDDIRGLVDRGVMAILEPGRADHQRDAGPDRGMQIGIERLRGREIDQYVARFGQRRGIAAAIDPARQCVSGVFDDTRQRLTHCTFAADYPDLRHSRSVSPPAAGPLFDLPYRIAT